MKNREKSDYTTSESATRRDIIQVLERINWDRCEDTMLFKIWAALLEWIEEDKEGERVKKEKLS